MIPKREPSEEMPKRELTEELATFHERASATSLRLRSPSASRASAEGGPLDRGSTQSKPDAAVDEARGELALAMHQAWLIDVITTPESRPLPVDADAAERLVMSSARLSALDRLELYRQSYHARLLECLADDFPVLREAAGVEGFEWLARGYIAEHPSRGPNLNEFGRHFPGFIRTARWAERPREGAPELTALPPVEFLADLAALEWALVVAVHAPSCPPMTPADVARVPPEGFPTARLVPNPSLSILHFDYPVNAFFQRLRHGEGASVPAPRESAVAVYRTERKVYRLELSAGMSALFESLARGTPLGEALELTFRKLQAHGAGEAELARMVMQGFRDGVESGLFAEIRSG
ncbi:MAG TPA: DNA-binding domain-containing protein [Polyangiaceae bacterium]|nr:DNA-binding domain-containing protein [Polyangiaceae bacterium]